MMDPRNRMQYVRHLLKFCIVWCVLFLRVCLKILVKLFWVVTMSHNSYKQMIICITVMVMFLRMLLWLLMGMRLVMLLSVVPWVHILSSRTLHPL